MIDDIDDIDKNDPTAAMKSGIPRPTSRPSSRPLSRPTPSARVRALGKDDIDEADDQNSPEEDDEDDEEEEDEEQGIQVEGLHFPVFTALAPQQNEPKTQQLRRKKIFHRRYAARVDSTFIKDDVDEIDSFEELCLSDYSFDSDLTSISFDKYLEDERDTMYHNLPFKPDRAYDPADFEHLAVSNDMKELFQYITRYTPQTIELDHKLRPFIPEYIPAVGDIDAFIKVPRPDGEQDKFGLIALDEPCAKQSDPTVLDLHLRAISKETTSKAVSVKKLENADKSPKEIDAWITSISNLHQSKPPPTVHYSKNMPDLEDLMQEWPPDFEEYLNKAGLPTADLDCPLDDYVDVICGILDIPVHKSKIQSLHVLFSLYMEFKNSQHFKAMEGSDDIENFIEDDDGSDSVGDSE